MNNPESLENMFRYGDVTPLDFRKTQEATLRFAGELVTALTFSHAEADLAYNLAGPIDHAVDIPKFTEPDIHKPITTHPRVNHQLHFSEHENRLN